MPLRKVSIFALNLTFLSHFYEVVFFEEINCNAKGSLGQMDKSLNLSQIMILSINKRLHDFVKLMHGSEESPDPI